MRASALLAKQAGGGSSGDHTARVLAALAPGTWSSDIVVPGFHRQDVEVNSWAPPGQACAPGQSGSTYFAFSSGIYCHGKKRYFFANEGAHVDYDGSGVGYFDFTTGKWVQTETPTRYGHNPADTIYMGSCQGVSPWGAGAYNGGAWPAESTSAWFCWPNSLGHFGAYTAHTYALTEWCPEANLIHRFAKGGFSDGTMNQGIWTIDPDTGLWGQNPKQQYLNGGGAPGSVAIADSIGWCIWVPEVQQLWNGREGAFGANTYDPVARTGRQTFSSSLRIDRGYREADFEFGLGCTIADPYNPGHRAIVYFHKMHTDRPYPTFEGIVCYPMVDVLPAPGVHRDVIPINFADGSPTGTVPPPLQHDTRALGYGSAKHDSVWFEGAKFKPGSTKIIIWHWMTGFWLLDTVTWTFSGPVASPPSWVSPGQIITLRMIQPMADYATSDYVPFMIVHPSINSTNPKGSGVFLYKFPTSLL